MSNVDQKIPFAQSINYFTDRKINDALQSYGQSFPCYVTAVNGSIVTVKFDVTVPEGITLPEVTCPIAGSEYIRYPIQPGCKGYCIPANVSLRNASGLGAGGAPPDLSEPGNLTALVFFPFGNTNFFTVNGQYLVMYGETGVEITTKNQDCKLTLTASGITIDLNGGNLIVNNGNTTMNGNLTVNGLITGTNGFAISGGTGGTMNITGNINQTGNFQNTGTLTNNGKAVGSTHTHGGVQTGSGTTGTPT
jgi:hypothetical protein